MVNIEGLDKARVLKALYDGTHVQGIGFLHKYKQRKPRTLVKWMNL